VADHSGAPPAAIADEPPAAASRSAVTGKGARPDESCQSARRAV